MGNTNIAWMFTLYEVGLKLGGWLARPRRLRRTQQTLRRETAG